MRSFVLPAMLVLCMHSAAEAMCGSRGGPAFRKPDGQCASWRDIEGGKCGTPPTTHCSLEGGGIGATSVAKVTDFITSKMPGTANTLVQGEVSATRVDPATFNKRTIRADGIACASQNAVASAATCLLGGAAPDCKNTVDQSIAKGECANVKAGTEARIEAGSHSFEWVRVSIGSVARPMWVQRRMVLE